MKHSLLRASALLYSLFVLSASAVTIDYEKQLLPILKDNCFACHNKTTTKGGLNMETPELMTKGGETGKGIEAGKGDKSLIYQAAAGEWDSVMPPKSNKVGAVKLTSGELALLKQWINEGALHQDRQERVVAWEPLPASFHPIYAAAIAPGGQFAAAARGNQISVYHLPTASLVTRLTDEALIKSGLYKQPGIAHRDVVPSLVFSPDSTRLATGSYREVKIWQRASAEPRTVPAPAAPQASKFKLAAAPGDAVSLIDQPTAKPLRDLKHGSAVTAFVMSADTQRIATAGADHKIKIWGTATGKAMLEIQGDLAAERAMIEKTDAVAKATVELAWQNEALKKAEKEVTDLAARLKKANELADIAKKALEEKRKDAKAKEDAKPAAEKALAEANNQVSKAPGGKPDAALTKKQADAKTKAEKAATDATLAKEALTRAEAAIVDTAREIQLVTEASTKAAAQVLATKATLDAAKKSLDAANVAKTEATKALPSAIPSLIALAFSPKGTQIAGVDAAGVLRIWSADSGRPVSQTSVTTAGKVQSLVWPADEGCIVTGDKGSVLVPNEALLAWKLERVLGTGDGKSPISDRVAALTFTADGKTLAVGSGEPSRSGDITLWELASGKMTANFDERHLDTVLCLDFSPDGKLLASGGADKAVRITDLATGKMTKVFEGHTHHVLGVSWRSDGRLLASAGADNAVKIWDWTIGDRRKNVDGWDKEVTSARYLGSSDTIGTTAGDGKVRIVNSDGGEVKQFPAAKGFMNSLSPTRGGNVLVAGGEDGVLKMWDVVSGKETASFAAEAN
jgi:WD40 repeat protein